jgi:hypothetical protein
VIGLLSPLGTFPVVAGPFLVSFGAIIGAPDASTPGPWLESWWRLVAISAFVCLIGLGLWFLLDQAGIAVVMVGSLLAGFAVAFGFRPQA